MQAAKNKSGTTMIEVLVAFIIVVLMMTLFARTMAAAVQMMNRSKQAIEKTEEFNQSYTLNRSTGGTPGEGNLTLSGAGVTLQLPQGRVGSYTDSAIDGITRYYFITTKIIGAGE